MERYKEQKLKEKGKQNLVILNSASNNFTKKYSYKNPFIPNSYKHICGNWNDGFVIEKETDKSQFVWVPVESLLTNGKLDTIPILQTLGRRNYLEEIFDRGGFYEPFTEELRQQFISIKKYGGFYISRYNISKNPITQKPQSVKGEFPWTKIDFSLAKEVAANFEKGNKVFSHIPYGAEYDSILEWIIESGAKSYNEVVMDSSSWGNYLTTVNTPNELSRNGSNENWCVNNIYDFAGNVSEWTQELLYCGEAVVRGGNYYTFGAKAPVASRTTSVKNIGFSNIGFRIALFIK